MPARAPRLRRLTRLTRGVVGLALALAAIAPASAQQPTGEPPPAPGPSAPSPASGARQALDSAAIQRMFARQLRAPVESIAALRRATDTLVARLARDSVRAAADSARIESLGNELTALRSSITPGAVAADTVRATPSSAPTTPFYRDPALLATLVAVALAAGALGWALAWFGTRRTLTKAGFL